MTFTTQDGCTAYSVAQSYNKFDVCMELMDCGYVHPPQNMVMVSTLVQSVHDQPFVNMRRTWPTYLRFHLWLFLMR